MILYRNMCISKYQVYDEAILELGYPPVAVLKSFISGAKAMSGISDYYMANGSHVDLDYSYNLDLKDVKHVYDKAAALVRKKQFLYYFGGIIMCDHEGNIQQEISSCYRLVADKKLISVTDEVIPLSSKVLRYCQKAALPTIDAGCILQYFSEQSRSILKDDRKLVELGFARVAAAVFVASQQIETKDELIFVVKLTRGKSLLILTLKQADINGLLQFRQR